ncbi:MAG: hypothetical protein JRH20_22005 [Deltaproteobacteria bacterium]|nr:hypothetical protein [Deltaproteobacteria bacterium]
MQPPHYAFYALADELSLDAVREIIHDLGLDESWLRITETTACYEERPLLQIEIYDLDTGEPVFAEEIGLTLAAEGRSALTVGSHPEENEVAFALYQDGELSFMWAGDPDDFEAEDEEGNEHKGRSGFEHIFSDLTGARFDDYLQATSVRPDAGDQADDQTLLLLRGRYVALPAGSERVPELHSFHEAELDIAESDEDRMALLLLDVRLVEELWKNQPAATVSAFLEAIAPSREGVLGPLTGAFSEVRQFIGEHPSDQPLATTNTPPLTAYELLAMATAIAFSGGHRVSHYDERFFPLLSLNPGGDLERVISDELDEIADLGLLSAMSEVLPYSAPEGQMLESIGDEELAPLAPWAVDDQGGYEGSIFLLDPKRLITSLGAFSEVNFGARCEQFAAAWCQLASDGKEDSQAWREARFARDAEEHAAFDMLRNEFAMLLALSQVNHLQPAILFYGR